eukprot:c33189_g1_i1 orf=1-213(+)
MHVEKHKVSLETGEKEEALDVPLYASQIGMDFNLRSHMYLKKIITKPPNKRTISLYLLSNRDHKTSLFST